MSQKSIYIPYLHLFLDLWAYTCIPTSLSISITEVTSLHKYSQEWFSFLSYTNKKRTVIGSLISSQLSLNREGRWGTSDDFATSSLHFTCSPLLSKTWRTPSLSVPWYCLPISSSVCLVFFPLSLCLARWVVVFFCQTWWAFNCAKHRAKPGLLGLLYALMKTITCLSSKPHPWYTPQWSTGLQTPTY